MASNPPHALRVRLSRPGDEKRVGAMASTLSEKSIRRRFMAAVPRAFAVAELRREVSGGSDQFAVVVEDAGGAMVGEAYAALLDDGSADAAFVVADRSQHHGIGTVLFAAVVRELAARGVRTLHIPLAAERLK